MYRWEIDVLEYNHYGDKVEKRTPVSILAETKAEVTEKVHLAFNAKYDDFRRFWSHGWHLKSMSEIEQPIPDDYGRPEKAPMGILTDA